MLRPILLGLLLLSTSGRTIAAATTSEPDRNARPVFGYAVALSGDQLFVSEISGTTPSSGIVHIYRRGNAGWTANGTLSVSGLADRAGFGSSLAAAGGTLLVGMRGDSLSGGVYVFSRGTDGSWSNAGKLPLESANGSRFGQSVALAGDWAFVGAPGENGSAGAVHLFRRTAGKWTAAGTLAPTGVVANDGFGQRIAIDGDRVAVSAPGNGGAKGMIFVFHRGADGNWSEEATLSGRRVPAGARLGESLALSGTTLYAGSPSANGFVGMVVGFAQGKDGTWAESSTLTPFESGPNRFGISLAKVGNELWIGAPFSDRREGRIYRALADADGNLTGMMKLGTDSLTMGSGFGEVLLVEGSTAVVGMPRDAGGLGTVMILAKNAQGNWRLASSQFAPRQELAKVTGGEVRCGTSGKAGEFECGNSSLLSFLPISAIGGGRATELNDNWGWTDPTSGREYALVGRSDGTSFVDVTDPIHPKYLGDLPLHQGANPSVWRDIKTYKNHAYIVADGAGPHGVQVFDLTRLRTVKTPQRFTEDAHYDNLGSAHNIVINEESGYAYAVGVQGGGETCGGGLHMIDIRQPKSPTFAGCFADPATGRAGTGYTHDAQCVMYHGPDKSYTGREICIASNETAISIADVTNKKAPKALSNASYPAVGYAHQGWLTEDQKFFYLGDELDEGAGQPKTRTMIWDVSDLEDPILVKQWWGTTPATDHNMYVKGNRLYQSNYEAGLRILDISDPATPREVGYLDTTPSGTTNQMSGSWSNYPYFKSGTIVVTSVGEGLFLVRDRTQAVP